MKMIFHFLILAGVSLNSFGGTDVSFRNNSAGTLKCWVSINNTYIPFLQLEPKEIKTFFDFKLGSPARCQTSINQNTSTVLTYFVVDSSGSYESLREYVDCTTCASGVTYRYATIIVPPNGQAKYN
jgi:hypothetical protein